MSSKPVVGSARTQTEAPRTIRVFLAGLKRVCELRGQRLLDIGCGDGTFTIPLGEGFEEVHGVDVQPHYIEHFKLRVLGNPKFKPQFTNAGRMHFPCQYFDAIISIETLEHVDDLEAVAAECARVLRPGGQLVITVPNRWFPIEGHGGRVFGRDFSRLPLITYVPWLHNRIANARVFTVARLDGLFVSRGFERRALSYLWPTFEHGGGGVQRKIQQFLRHTFPLMRWMETSPLRMFGTSIVVRYQRR
jgi:SAM-dependent methyltransferase